MFALVDGNSFYASCEAAFRPDLADTPIVVLSNNDSCIVAANAQAKALGKIMYQPYFKVAGLLKHYKVAVFSSNYELYGDLSYRMHDILAGFASAQEVYSIDECFLDFTGMRHWDFTQYGHTIKQRVLKQIGIPVAVGIGLTKTLAKVANNRAKKVTGFNHVLSFSDLSEKEQNQLLLDMEVADVWGVGHQWAKRLHTLGIFNALQLKQVAAKKIKQHFGVVLESTVHELNGVACQQLVLNVANKQSIVSSRSFSRPITQKQEMQQVVARYVARAAEKLRAQRSFCKQIIVSIETNRFKNQTNQYRHSQSITLIHPSQHTGHLIERAKRCLDGLWQSGVEYKKASVMLSDLTEQHGMQFDLFAQQPKYSHNPKAKAMMHVMDEINLKMGKQTCRMGAEGSDQFATWSMKRGHLSPRYSTRWDEMIVAFLR